MAIKYGLILMKMNINYILMIMLINKRNQLFLLV